MSTPRPARPLRLFWLGMHKVLSRTELPHLRAMGYEVFNPPYLSPVYDQSAERRVDRRQPTTLPPEVFERLITTDFFYREVEPDIAELLNAHFDAVLVTINIDWLGAMLRAFDGPLLYRVYGQPYSLSEMLVTRGLWPLIVARDNFTVLPFAAESIASEQRWFQALCTEPVPYQISDEVFDWSGRWPNIEHWPEIATNIPNVENAYYAAAYQRFAANCPHQVFRIYGPQRSIPADSRIVGALDRDVFLERLTRSAGFFYPYDDDVCYLPPIEMMEIGGPVLYRPGSLLDQFMHTAHGGPPPNRVADDLDLDDKLARLIANDAGFADELRAAQEPVRQRYDRANVKPIFERVVRLTLEASANHAALAVDDRIVRGAQQRQPSCPARWLAILLHIDGLFGYSRGRALGFEGIPRVVETVVRLIARQSDLCFLISTTASARSILADLFFQEILQGRVVLRLVTLGATLEDFRSQQERLWLVEDLNADKDLIGVLIPHYYLFPEAMLLTKPTVLYLPDYFPFLMPDVVFDVDADKDAQNKAVGVAIARKASAILTNSRYTRDYLPDAGFVAEEDLDRVVVAYLPLLGSDAELDIDLFEREQIESKLAGRPYLFYPTANRPNKQFAFLLTVFAELRAIYPDLALVLTGDLASVPGVAALAQRFDLSDHLVFVSRVSESALAWLYRHCAAVSLTSTLEGNFPPQVREALANDAPLVATRLPMITEVLGELADDLMLCPPMDTHAFVRALSAAIDDREGVLRVQKTVREVLAERCSETAFVQQIERAIDLLERHTAS